MLTKGYTESIKYLAENKMGGMMYNVDEEHAVVFLSELIKNAEDYVHIICKNIEPNITENPVYLDAVKLFLDKENSRELKILLTDNYDNSFKEREIFKLLEKYPEKMSIKYLGYEVKANDDASVNWTVSDGRAFWLKKDIENYIAFGNFDHPEFAEKFDRYFETFFAKGKPIADATKGEFIVAVTMTKGKPVADATESKLVAAASF